MSIELELPKITELRPRITVIGIGGAGGNAVNNMIASGLEGVEFVVANTDSQALAASSAEHVIQLGVNLTLGLGAGAKPEIGEAAAEEALDEIRAQVSGSNMVFVAAGMGGGTGTGAAAVVARVAHEMDILTVGVVTKPFHFEGNRRMRVAEAGVAELARHVDTLIAIPNQNLFRIANEKTTFAEAFELADQVLHAGISCITDLIVREGLINLDFADVRAIMRDMGAAMMGTGQASGERRAIEAAELAIANPLLDDVTLKGARGLLVSISGAKDLSLYEVDAAASRVREEVDPEANIIVGASFDESIGDAVRVSIVASGLRDVPASQPGLAGQAAAAIAAAGGAAAGGAASQRGPAPQAPHASQRPQVTGGQPVQRQADQGKGARAPLRPPVPAQAAAQEAGGRTAPRPGAARHASRQQPQHKDIAPTPQKRGPDNDDEVTIELGPPTLLAGAPKRGAGRWLGRPGAGRGHEGGDSQAGAERQPQAAAAFVPQAPADGRRQPPRVPEIDAFPPLARKQYEAQAEAPRRRTSIFDRLTGRIRAESAANGEEKPGEALRGGPFDNVATQSGNIPDDEGGSEEPSIPGFFRRKIAGGDA